MKRRDFIVLITAVWGHGRVEGHSRRNGCDATAIMSTSATDAYQRSNFVAFMQSLQNLGWTDGRNVAIDDRWVPAAPIVCEPARDLVDVAPDVILVQGSVVPTIKQLTSTIPIVFVLGSEAYVASLARPGNNVAGIGHLES